LSQADKFCQIPAEILFNQLKPLGFIKKYNLLNQQVIFFFSFTGRVAHSLLLKAASSLTLRTEAFYETKNYKRGWESLSSACSAT